jgi:hypothetical protein
MGSYDLVPEDYDGPPFPHEIVCNSRWVGQERHTHERVEQVRVCFEAAHDEARGIEVWPCSWLLEGRYDDGSIFTFECGQPTRFTPERGDGAYECLAGHDHVPAWVRDAQGWDYAEDPDEAKQLAQAGTRPVQLDGKPWM